MAEIVYRRKVELLEAELGEELVTLDTEAGKCFGFNEVATSVWRLLATPQTEGAITERLLAEYEVDAARCAEELRELLDDMADKGLIATQ